MPPSATPGIRKPLWLLFAALTLTAGVVVGVAVDQEWLVALLVFVLLAAAWLFLGFAFNKLPNKQYDGYDYSLWGHWKRLLSKSAPPPPPPLKDPDLPRSQQDE